MQQSCDRSSCTAALRPLIVPSLRASLVPLHHLSISHSLLCLDTSLTGPGILYNLRFQASTTAQLTEVRVRWVQSYDAGFFVGPVKITNARTQVADPSGARPPWPPESGLRLRIAPNPFNPTTTIRVESGAAGRQELAVRDVRGPAVRTLWRGALPAGSRDWVWDGRDEQGRRVASGVYVVAVTGREARASRSVVLLKWRSMVQRK